MEKQVFLTNLKTEEIGSAAFIKR